MLNKLAKMFRLQDSENEVLIVSERRPGESELAQNKRIEEMEKILTQKPTKSDKKKLDALLDMAMTAIEKWKKECLIQGKTPSCINSFTCVDHKTKYPYQNKYMIFGEQSEVMALLQYINEMLNPDDGEDSLFN